MDTPTVDALPPALRKAIDLALAKGARAPTLLHVTEVAGYTDFVLVMSGRSDRHVEGITEGIIAELKQDGVKPLGTDGLNEHLWALLDYDDFIIHVFYHPVRAHYDLESMLSDAPRVALEVPEDLMETSDLVELDAPDPMPVFRGDRSFGGYEDEFEIDSWAAIDGAETDEASNDTQGDDDLEDPFDDVRTIDET